jgi:hypothetical protein
MALCQVFCCSDQHQAVQTFAFGRKKLSFVGTMSLTWKPLLVKKTEKIVFFWKTHGGSDGGSGGGSGVAVVTCEKFVTFSVVDARTSQLTLNCKGHFEGKGHLNVGLNSGTRSTCCRKKNNCELIFCGWCTVSVLQAPLQLPNSVLARSWGFNFRAHSLSAVECYVGLK